MLTYNREKKAKEDIFLFIKEKRSVSFEDIVGRFRMIPKRLISEILKKLEASKKITHQVINERSLFSVN
jgi:hypothetical protein